MRLLFKNVCKRKILLKFETRFFLGFSFQKMIDRKINWPKSDFFQKLIAKYFFDSLTNQFGKVFFFPVPKKENLFEKIKI
jgi:hypothetical protein